MERSRVTRIERMEKEKQLINHDFKIRVGVHGSRYFVDGEEVSEIEYRKYPKQNGDEVVLKVTIGNFDDK